MKFNKAKTNIVLMRTVVYRARVMEMRCLRLITRSLDVGVKIADAHKGEVVRVLEAWIGYSIAEESNL